jgi:hypothetical protein
MVNVQIMMRIGSWRSIGAPKATPWWQMEDHFLLHLEETPGMQESQYHGILNVEQGSVDNLVD